MTISVVIPTWNEAAELPETLRRLRLIPEVTEIVVSDAGSSDDTQTIASQFGAHLVIGARSRGGQLRRGAHAGTGEVIWMVHADTWVPSESGQEIARVLSDSDVAGGAFVKEFRDPPWLTRGSAWRCRFRMRHFQFAYGDQALFVRRTVLQAIGGVPDVPLMEESLLCTAIRRHGRMGLTNAVVSTSPRRFRQRGVLRTYLRMGWIHLRFCLNTSPETLRRLYERP